jgi:hypothetical protein
MATAPTTKVQHAGKGIEIRVEGDKAVITFDLKARHGPSGSGKSQIVASTGGNVLIGGTEVKLGLNAYTSA